MPTFTSPLQWLLYKMSGDLMVKVPVWQPRDRGLEPHMDNDHDSSYDMSTGWFQESDLRVILISCENLLLIELK